VLGDQCDFNIAFLDDVVEMNERCSRNFVERSCHLVGDCSLALSGIVGGEMVVGGRKCEDRHFSLCGQQQQSATEVFCLVWSQFNSFMFNRLLSPHVDDGR